MTKSKYRPEPTFLDVAQHLAAKLAEYAAYTVIAAGILVFGIATGWLG